MATSVERLLVRLQRSLAPQAQFFRSTPLRHMLPCLPTATARPSPPPVTLKPCARHGALLPEHDISLPLHAKNSLLAV